MNPELRRLLWLEVTPQRLWLIPLALIGGALVMGRALPFALPSLALAAFLAMTLLWGARQAANAVLDEARARTWDVQRMSALVACVASYVAGFANAHNPIQYRRVAQALRERRFRRSLEELPLWSSSAALALLLSLTASILGSTTALRAGYDPNFGAAALALALLMLRNLALLNWLSLRSRTARAEVATLIYLALLDHILPGLLRIAGLPAIAGLLELPLFDRPWTAVGMAALHAAVAIGLALLAYRATRPILSAPDDRRF